MKHDLKIAIVGAVVGGLVTALLGLVLNAAGILGRYILDDGQRDRIASELANDIDFRDSVVSKLPFKPADFDSEWIELGGGGQSLEFELKFDGVPSHFSAYYRLPTGEVIPWGVNQYGDGGQINGVLVDFDGKGKVYIRTPAKSGKYAGHNIHLGYYRARDKENISTYLSLDNVAFKIHAWR